jgi:cell division protein FtsZ
MSRAPESQVKVRVVGVGGAGGNAIARMVKSKLHGVEYLALNTDAQVLSRNRQVPSIAIGPGVTRGMGSGGHPDVGRKAIKESHDQVSEALSGSDMVFVAAGMGGGTGTGAASTVAEIARRSGALTVGVVTMPFSFEGPTRRAVAEQGLQMLGQKVDTLIAVENDRLLPSLEGKVKLDKAFRLADEVLRQGVQGVSDIITVPGLINVDFADVRSVMSNGGLSFMAMGEAKGPRAALDAARAALSNPLFDAPLEGATGILLNVKGGKDLTLGQVHEVADAIRKAGNPRANVMFGVVQDRWMRSRVEVTLVATGLTTAASASDIPHSITQSIPDAVPDEETRIQTPSSNGHVAAAATGGLRLL